MGADRGLTVVWDDRFREYDLGPGHPFTETSRWLAFRLLEETGFFSPSRDAPTHRIDRASEATREELTRFHRAPYVDRVERLSDEGSGALLDQGDTPSFDGCYPASARVVGGTLAALEELRSGRARVAVNLAGGLHHAHPDRASGFCIFNDVAIAIASALAPGGGFSRVAYIDIDAHHGDGVMYGFYESGRLLDIDFHQDGRTLFPGTGDASESGEGDGEGLKVNVPLPPWTGDEAFLPLFRRLVPPLLRSFRPELIVLQHGTDGHADDKLAQLEYTPTGYLGTVRLLKELADELCGGRILMTGGGGYTPANVSRVLARSAGVLARRTSLDGDRTSTPAAWRREYEQALERPAPSDLVPPAASGTSPWRPERAERLVRELEKGTGLKFPDAQAE